MNKYIVTAQKEKGFNAACKARDDVEAIAAGLGYKPIQFQGENTAKNGIHAIRLLAAAFSNWVRLSRIARDSMVLIQYPHYPLKTAFLMRWFIPLIRKAGKTKFIFLIHDLNSLRGTFGKAAVYSDRHLIRCADMIICHNEKMRAYLTSQGIQKEKLKTIRLFDYLMDCKPRNHRLTEGIVIAGNLNPQKSGYIKSLIESCSASIPIHLYGEGLTIDRAKENAVYHGVFSPDELPGEMEGAFGIVWDGPSVRSCEGKMGEYLRYTSPHKASLYLASGIPVIAWNQAAIAEEITDNGLGFTVSSLEEIEALIQSVTTEQYDRMCENARQSGTDLSQGRRLASIISEGDI